MRPIPHRTTFIGITLALTTIVAVLAAATTPGGASRRLAAMPAAAARMSGSSIPLLFEPSTRRQGEYVARGAGYSFALRDDGVIASFGRETVTRFGIAFPGGSKVAPIVESPQAARVNYLIGGRPADWRTDVPTFGRVRYANVYPGIDAVFYGNGRQLEYDLVIAAGTDPSVAGVQFSGVESVALEADGDLLLRVGGRDVRQSRPIAYQMIGAVRRPIDAHYRLDGRTARFDVGLYDRRHPLVIDPVLVYSTFFGGSANDAFLRVAVDATGATYTVGETFSTNFPGSPLGPVSGTNPQNAVVVKLDRLGRVVFSTYIGGSNADTAAGVEVDSTGAVYVSGRTLSTDFPVTTGALQTNLHGDGTRPDAFVVKLAPAGNRIVYATYFGGTFDEFADDLAVDSSGRVYITGTTQSDDLPVTTGAWRTSKAAGNSSYVAKFNAAGSALVYSTYLSGRAQQTTAIALDSRERATVVGVVADTMTTTNTAGPVVASDAFVLQLNETGSGITYATRFGGSGSDVAYDLAIDQFGSAWVTGSTNSADFPILPDYAYQPKLAGGNDAFVAEIYANGYFAQSTFLGGSDNDFGKAISITGWAITVFGQTLSTNFPVRDAIQSTNAGSLDTFVTRLYAGYDLMFSTYLGGSSTDVAVGMAVDGAGAITGTGETWSGNFPVKNAAQTSGPPTANGPDDGYITRLAMLPRGVLGAQDVVVRVADVSTLHGNWIKEADATAAGGYKLRNPDKGLSKLSTAQANPTDYFEFTVNLSGGPYRVWLRGKADNNSYNNDSVYLQFSFADQGVDEGRQLFPIGTTDGMPIVLEDCNGCGVHGWGWQDDAYGKWARATDLYFYSGTQPTTVRVQRREDGISIDQIVFAPEPPVPSTDPYYLWAPGYQKDDDTIVTAAPTSDVVLWPGTNPSLSAHGTWRIDSDGSAAGGSKVRNPDAGASKLGAPLANPINYVDITFEALANVPYRLWIRGRADGDSWNNDSVYVQFSGSVTPAGAATWRSGTTSAATIVLEDCTGCGLKGWGWQDNGYGTGVLGQLVYFAQSGPQAIRIQTREDGLSIDQILLSPRTYLNASPGATKNDTTIVAATQP